MHITRLAIENFGAFQNITLPNLTRLVVLIGENDSGKTTILRAVKFALGSEKVRYAEVANSGAATQKLEVSVEFDVEIDGATQTFRRVLDSSEKVRVESLGLHPPVEIERISAKTQKLELENLCTQFAIDATGSAKDLFERLSRAAQVGTIRHEKRWAHAELPPGLVPVLVNAEDFEAPTKLLQTAMVKEAKKALADMRHDQSSTLMAIEEQVKRDVSEKFHWVEGVVSKALPGTSGITVSSEYTFAPGVAVEMDVRANDAQRKIQEFGAGTRRRAWMAISTGLSQHDDDIQNQILLYDEPDTSLHYEAQKSVARDLVDRSKRARQVFISTHSTTIVESVKLEELYLLARDAEGTRRISRAVSSPESTSRALEELANAAHEMGLGNLAMLYDKCFVLVEGETEEGLLPVLFEKIYGGPPNEFGVRIVNLETCGAFHAVINAVLSYRKQQVILLLDVDARDRFNEIAERHVNSGQIFYVGQPKELEDAFSDEVWLKTLNANYPREDNLLWTVDHLEAARKSDKFSEALKGIVRGQTRKSLRQDARKPMLGRKLGATIDVADIPAQISAALDAAYKIARK